MPNNCCGISSFLYWPLLPQIYRYIYCQHKSERNKRSVFLLALEIAYAKTQYYNNRDKQHFDSIHDISFLFCLIKQVITRYKILNYSRILIPLITVAAD